LKEFRSVKTFDDFLLNHKYDKETILPHFAFGSCEVNLNVFEVSSIPDLLLNFCIDAILREARLEDRLVKQIFYHFVSLSVLRFAFIINSTDTMVVQDSMLNLADCAPFFVIA
jgi:hypothetical protein